MVSNPNHIRSTFYLCINFVCMKKTAKIRRDNKTIQRNIDWLQYKTRYLKKRVFRLLGGKEYKDSFLVRYYPYRFCLTTYLKRIGINQQVVKKFHLGLKIVGSSPIYKSANLHCYKTPHKGRNSYLYKIPKFCLKLYHKILVVD